MAIFQLFFQSREQAVVRRGQIRRIGLGDQVIGSPGRPVSSGLQVPGEPGIVVQEQDPLCEPLAAFSLQNVLQLHQQR